jgi:hypothetical protein
VPGETQGCVCGARSGAQVCGEDGVSYSACDCGSAIFPTGGSSGASGVGGGAGGVSGASAGGTGGMIVPGEDAGPPPVATGPGTPIPEPADEAAFLWDETTLHSFELQVSEADLARIDADPSAEEYVPATLKFGDEVYTPVGLRYKGSIGAFVKCTAQGVLLTPAGAKSCDKLSMKVSLNWMMPGARFHGLKKLQFHSMNSDASLLRERLGYAMFREMGVAGSRAQHVRLLINGAFAGLFLLVEEVDSRFTRAHFSDGGDGNLYKEIWPKWTDEAAYHPPALQTNDESPTLSYDRVLRFAQGLESAADDAGVVALVEQWMDVQNIMAFIAVDRSLVHDDGMFHWYCGLDPGGGNNPGACSNHNYYWYEEAGWDRLWLVPWDMDLILGAETTGFTTLPGAWDAANPSCFEMPTLVFGVTQLPPACDKLTHGLGTLQTRYKAEVRRFLDGPFAASNVNAKFDAWSTQIEAAVQEASAIGHTPSPSAWMNATTDLRNRIANRRTAMESVAGP